MRLSIFEIIGYLFWNLCMYIIFPIYFLFVYMLTYLRYSNEYDFSSSTDFGFFLSLIGFLGIVIKLSNFDRDYANKDKTQRGKNDK